MTGNDEGGVCDGCLGDRKCWVCLGTGNLNTRWVPQTCTRCGGTGRCSLCRPMPVPDVVAIPQPDAVMTQTVDVRDAGAVEARQAR